MQHTATARVSSIVLPSARLGPPSPLVDLVGRTEMHEIDPAAEVDDELRAGISYGRSASIAPYLPQDDYDRVLRDTEHRVVVLENERIRAEILPDLGARLRSLVDTESGRELLSVNPVFQPADLALRNAWFSGGVEWNIGTIGHSPFTVSSLHGELVERADGAACFRAWEYERLRGVVFSIEFALRPDADCLLVTVTVDNPSASPAPMYWWSNIAVEETPGTRVLVPATSAWRFGYERTVTREAIPGDGVDRTRPTEATRALDYFFDLGGSEHPWISAVDEHGTGLLQTSTRELRGRKLFVWGTGAGGDRWQSWLSHGATRYLEIQAGLARTQLEHVEMPARARWRWTESYGAVRVDPRTAHGADWLAAVGAVEGSGELRRRTEFVDAERQRDRSTDRQGDHVSTGSGWGALEQRRRAAVGESPLPVDVDFPADTLGDEQAYWLALLDGSAPTGDPFLSYQRDPSWLPLLEARGDAPARLHAAVIRALAGESDAALAEAESVADEIGWLGHRIVAQLLRGAGRIEESADAYERALAQHPDDRALLAEAAHVLLDAGRADRLVALIDAAPRSSRVGRIRYLRARALLALGRASEARAFFDDAVELPDLTEGDEALTDLWRDIAVAELGLEPGESGRAAADRRRPVPPAYDFRMR